MRQPGVVLIAALLAAPAFGGDFSLSLRTRPEADGKHAVATNAETWSGDKVAVIVCDVWDAHHCLNAVRREEEMLPRMEAFLTAARAKGALVIHAPSGCMDAYKDHPARTRAQAAPARRRCRRTSARD